MCIRDRGAINGDLIDSIASKLMYSGVFAALFAYAICVAAWLAMFKSFKRDLLHLRWGDRHRFEDPARSIESFSYDHAAKFVGLSLWRSFFAFVLAFIIIFIALFIISWAIVW